MGNYLEIARQARISWPAPNYLDDTNLEKCLLGGKSVRITYSEVPSVYPTKTDLTVLCVSLPSDLSIRDCIQFSFYNWIS